VFYVIAGILLVFFARQKLMMRSVRQYSATDLSAILKKPGEIVLLDVRTARERQARSIPGSIHIPLHELGSRMEELERHKGKEILCYCQSGNRSLSAALRLKKKGFRVANLRGGIVEWSDHNR
jgi:rhodanese-related sulfurtransferase